MFTRIAAFRHDPACALLHSGFFEQQGQRHSRPLTATGESVRILSGCIRRDSRGPAGACRGAVPMALDEMKSRYRWQAFQFVHSEYQRTVDHTMDQQTMLLRIDVRRLETVRNDEVERCRCDHPHLVLEGGPKSERHRLIL